MTGQHLTEDQLQHMIASDPHAPEALEDQLAQAQPFTEAFPALAEAMRKNAQGGPKAGNPLPEPKQGLPACSDQGGP